MAMSPKAPTTDFGGELHNWASYSGFPLPPAPLTDSAKPFSERKLLGGSFRQNPACRHGLSYTKRHKLRLQSRMCRDAELCRTDGFAIERLGAVLFGKLVQAPSPCGCAAWSTEHFRTCTVPRYEAQKHITERVAVKRLGRHPIAHVHSSLLHRYLPMHELCEP